MRSHICIKWRQQYCWDKFAQKGGDRYIFVHGAIRVSDKSFDKEIWEDIYKTAKERFEDSEILGFALQVQEQVMSPTKEMNDIFKTHFDREDAVMILYEPIEKEDTLFVEDNGALKQHQGYYIYYDKNKSMQEYMVSQNEGKSVEKEAIITDKAIRNFRKIVEEKRVKDKKVKENKEKENAVKEPFFAAKTSLPSTKAPSAIPKTPRFLYVASTFLVLTILVIGVTMINNYDKMKNMELTLSDIVNSSKLTTEVSNNNAKIDKESMTETKSTAPQPVEKTTDAIAQSTEKPVTTDLAALSQTESSAQQPLPNSEKTATEEAGNTTASETEAKAASAPVQRVEQASYIVKAGDTLADICKVYYGNADRLEEICALNGIENPNHILLGQKILLP